MKAIAMRCTQEDWDSVKDKIENVYLSDFETFNYLVTNAEGITKNLANVAYWNKNSYNRTVYETFDKDILFDALDIVEEKVWNGNEMQLCVNGEWIDSTSECKFRFKPINPKVKELEIQAEKLGYKIVKL